ncbi:LLM class flavin-dependent oxidoreductase [Thioalkalivibrio sp. ALMg11]|uniref:LLM class flavin-dependent oxidoreductase n=1 Tax=Thioalkalivibrio sp. ALMg11 TaxID=1158165 RepID=UPI00035CA5F2|nr:LLM class flavin-dependent oxidoreductase [Thioalkalivibrio sp. ALMg11]
MRFDLFHELSVPDFLHTSEAEVLENTLRLWERADRLGFGTAWLVEHHLMPEFSHSTAPDLVLAAASQRTKRLRLGLGVVPLPYHHPLRVAQRVGMLDQLSGGRLDLGIGRGFSPREYATFGAEMSESRARVDAGLDALRQAFATGRITQDGPFHHLDDVPVMPRPVQDPHPPIWTAAVSPESFTWAAEQGIGALAGPFKPWQMIREDIRLYHEAWDASRTDVAHPPRVGMTLGVLCLPDGKRARREAKPAFEWFYRHMFQQTLPVLERLIEGYDYYRSLGRFRHLVKAGINLKVLDMLGMTLVGTPAECRERIEGLRAAGVDQVLLAFGAGAVPHALAEESMDCFAEEVMPAFADSTPVAAARTAP